MEEDPRSRSPERVGGQDAASAPGEQGYRAHGHPREACAKARAGELARGQILLQHAELFHLRHRVRLHRMAPARLLQHQHAAVSQHSVHLTQDVGPLGDVVEGAVA